MEVLRLGVFLFGSGRVEEKGRLPRIALGRRGVFFVDGAGVFFHPGRTTSITPLIPEFPASKAPGTLATARQSP